MTASLSPNEYSDDMWYTTVRGKCPIVEMSLKEIYTIRRFLGRLSQDQTRGFVIIGPLYTVVCNIWLWTGHELLDVRVSFPVERQARHRTLISIQLCLSCCRLHVRADVSQLLSTLRISLLFDCSLSGGFMVVIRSDGWQHSTIPAVLSAASSIRPIKLLA